MKKQRKTSSKVLRQRRTRLATRLSGLDSILRGTLVTRYKKCGKPGCHCVHDQGHGPAYYLSVTLGPGKTKSYYVPVRLKKAVERAIAKHQKARTVLEEITRINRELLERGEIDDDSSSD